MGIGALQHKCDSQAGLVEAFGGLLAKGNTKETVMLKKIIVIKKAWLATIERNNKSK